MILYLIRHGKTDAHIDNRRQSPSSPLGELGKKQAKALAQRVTSHKINHLYSSDWPRAYQTAEAISDQLGLPIKIHPLVHEAKKPSILDNVKVDSKINLKFLKEREDNKGNFDWKFKNGGESLNETIIRAKNVLQFLEKEHQDDSVGIVSHGIFMAVLITLMLLGLNFEKETFRRVFLSLRFHNAGVSSFKYNSKYKQWTMISLNDHVHLENIDN